MLLDVIRHRESRQPTLDFLFCGDVTQTVGFEQAPLVRVVLRQIAMPPAIRLCGGAGDAEIPDERLAHGELLLLCWQTQCLAGGVQARRVAAVEAVQHRVPPLVYRQQMSVELREAVPLERGVIGVFDVIRAFYCLVEPVRENLTLRQVYNLHRAIIDAVCEQKNLKVRALHILVGPRLSDWDAAEGFKVDAEVVLHPSHLSPAIISA